MSVKAQRDAREQAEQEGKIKEGKMRFAFKKNKYGKPKALGAL